MTKTIQELRDEIIKILDQEISEIKNGCGFCPLSSCLNEFCWKKDLCDSCKTKLSQTQKIKSLLGGENVK